MLLHFHLGSNAFAFRLDAVKEVVPMAKLIQLPGSPDLLGGFLNLRGRVVPVLRLGLLFGVAAEPDLYTPLIVLKGMQSRVSDDAPDRPLAVLVDRVIGLIPLNEDRLLDVPVGESVNGCVDSLVLADGGTISLLSPRHLLLEQEQQSITRFCHLADERMLAAAGLRFER
jgi:purine-binding chemotaxis protein CheW